MSSVPHTHDWHYNDAEAMSSMSQGIPTRYVAIRYCKDCLKVEELRLKTDDGNQ